MAERLMTLDLLRCLDIVDDDVAAIVDTFTADPIYGAVKFGDGYQLDPAAAVANHPFALNLIRQPWSSLELKRTAVRAAILLARPEKP
ncbi:hypothetical protein MFUR16E_22910 [Methylobacterium fujisawaense]|uniref:hypothetical protein n=1 Tax=Methylobacterium fujisawaense TaxID=107400 RepID=UPI002F2BD3B9